MNLEMGISDRTEHNGRPLMTGGKWSYSKKRNISNFSQVMTGHLTQVNNLQLD